MTRPTAAPRSILAVLVVLTAGLLLAGWVAAGAASAKEAAWWQLSAHPRPTHLAPNSDALLVVRAWDIGNAAISGSKTPVTISDKLPANVTAISARGAAGIDTFGEGEGIRGPVTCSLGATVTCTWEGPETLQPYEVIEMYISVHVGAAASGSQNQASISGGEAYRCTAVEGGHFSGPFCKTVEATGEAPGQYEAELDGTAVPPVSATQSLVISEEATPFGLADYAFNIEGDDGTTETQAGAHPFQLTTTLALNESSSPTHPPGFPRDVQLNLPPGLVGNAQVIGQCTEAEFSEAISSESGNINSCPNDSAIGVATASVAVETAGLGLQDISVSVPVFNLKPGPGEPARFGFEVEKTPVVIDTAVRTGTDYGVVARVNDISEFAVFQASNITLWGVPGAASHRLSRGWNCLAGGFYREFRLPELLPACGAKGDASPGAFLRTPTSCVGPLETSAEVDSWQKSSTRLRSAPSDFGHQPESLDGCGRLPFAPSFSLTPDVQTTSTPTGLSVDVHVPQESSEAPGGLAESDIKSTTVALPEGFVLNAASANGLEACSEAQIGFLAGASTATQKVFTSTLASPFCPGGAKVGTVKIKVPVIAHPLEGAMYLARQGENPFETLIATYIVAEDPVSGVLVKLPGRIDLDASTGRVSATFDNTPQAPIEELEVHLFGGPLAALATPAHCGTYASSAAFTPWSGNASASVSSSAIVSSGPGGGACPSQLPFAPRLTAGTTSNKGGAFGPLTTSITREDGEQNIEAVSLRLPPGLTAVIASVKPCAEPQASAGTCGAESLVGHTTESVGVGTSPVSVTGGQVFLTGPYNGAPFGLSIVVPAKAGPFDLGTVVVRATVQIDPHTAQVTVTTGAIPQILQGVPIQIRRVTVAIDRPGFTLNPTNCAPLGFSGSVAGAQGASAPVSAPFEAVNCATLGFAPKLAASVGGHATKANGVSFTTKLIFPKAPLGSQASIAKVKVVLPIQLPTRLSTLNKACLAKVFEANPALCPAASAVGSATARTPLLPVPLTGPAYLVSHGGEAFPALTIVLQGDGVTYQLVGTTLIRKGITSTTFKTVADVPVSAFDLTLPAGRYSVLTANLPLRARGSFCGRKLVMPTAFVAQNGAELQQSTPIAVSGCAKKKAIKGKRRPSKRGSRHK